MLSAGLIYRVLRLAELKSTQSILLSSVQQYAVVEHHLDGKLHLCACLATADFLQGFT